MPIVYGGILAEHSAVRRAVGIFDLSHMGQFVAAGAQVAEWLDGLTANSVANMRPNQARYNIFTNDGGGALDDTIIYRFADRWLIVVNGSNTEKMWRRLSSQVRPGIVLNDRTPLSALIALQGPRALEVLAPLSDVDLGALKYYHAIEGTVAGVPAEVARTGYTGEDGFELFVAAEQASALWERFLVEGRRVGLRPAGLGARDILRLEAGMPLYGHELSEEITPLMAGLDWAVKFDKPKFPGKEALLRQKSIGGYDRIVGLTMDGRAPARAGYSVYADGAKAGEIRSGSPAPALGGKNVATALVGARFAAIGTKLEVDIRGQRHGGVVAPQPFYTRPRNDAR